MEPIKVNITDHFYQKHPYLLGPHFSQVGLTEISKAEYQEAITIKHGMYKWYIIPANTYK